MDVAYLNTCDDSAAVVGLRHITEGVAIKNHWKGLHLEENKAVLYCSVSNCAIVRGCCYARTDYYWQNWRHTGRMAVFPMPRGVFHAGQVHYGRKTQKSKCGIQSSLATTSCNQGSSRNPCPGADLLSLTTNALVEATVAPRHFVHRWWCNGSHSWCETSSVRC